MSVEMDLNAGQSFGLITKLSEIIGTSEPALRLLLSILAGYPLALIHRKTLYGKDANLQHIYFIITGLLIGYFNYGLDIFHTLFAVLFTYLTLVLTGGAAVSVIITFIFNMGYLLLGYFYCGTNDYDINWTMPYCVLVLRLIGASYDLYDGRQPMEKLSEENKKVAILKRPPILEYFGYMFFPASFLVGPQFPIRRYQSYIEGRFGEDGKPPDCIAASIKRFSLGLLYLSIFQLVQMYVSDDYLLSDDYGRRSFIKKLFLLGLWGRITMYKYISCWLLTEGACIMFGVTHNGVDENNKIKWNGCENVKLQLFETTTQFNHYIQSFNVNTNHWVAQYIYKRLKFLGNRFISQAASLLFLAIWHGFHSGYYICFAFEFIVMYLEKDLQSILKKNPKILNILQSKALSFPLHIFLRIYTFVFMGWCIAPFALLTFDRYWKVFASVYHIGFIVFVPWPFIYGPALRLILKSLRGEHRD